jgi:hypothetical protein
MSDKEIFHVWESRRTSPAVTVQVPTARAIQSAKDISEKVDNDFMSAMFSSMGDRVTIKVSGSVSAINLKLEDARDLARWLLEHIE